jgi:proton glutamate symport protein
MSRATKILLSLAAGLAVGALVAAFAKTAVPLLLQFAQPIGTAWLNGLQMTVVPLVVALVITGVAATAEAANAGRLAARAILYFVVTVFVTGTIGALVTPLLLDLAPIPQSAAASLRTALVGAGEVTPPPPMAEFFSTIVPTNVIAAASGSSFLSLIIFTLAFAFAVTRLAPEPRGRIVALFQAVQDAMLVLVDWVLWLAPIGVFALAFTVSAQTGTAAIGALLHYIVVVSSVGLVIVLIAYPIALIGGGVSLPRFARALAPAQAVGISTQSSLASLPAMLKGAETLGIGSAAAGLVLPLAVAMFRATQPAMNIAISIYIARWFGIPIDVGHIAAAVAVAALVSLGSVSLPAQITFFASVAPPAIALGVPIAPLGLLIAVETVPDIFRTVGNISMDMAALSVATCRQRRASAAGLVDA